MSEPLVLIDKADGVATVTLNRPTAMNALSRALRKELVAAFASLKQDDSIGAVILTGAGKAFCAGLDLKELGSGDGEAAGNAVAGADVVRAVSGCGKPVIGAINGFAITGGFELATACDFLIASTQARFADTHARVGVMPGWGLSQKLSRLIGVGRAKELSLTGNYLGPEKAEAWGLVNRVVAPEDLLPLCRALALDMLSCDRETMLGYKRVIDAGYADTLANGLRLENDASLEHIKNQTPDKIEARRVAVQERGRQQQK